MLISELNNQLDMFIKSDSQMRTILIDGKWGCGKTFTVNKFAENSNYIYLSLFGIKRKEDIIVRLSEYLDSNYIININNEYCLKSSFSEEPYNGGLIVFDDLERTGLDLTISLYGIVDGLRKLGFKIICICNSEQIKDKKSFLDFREKTFDKFLNVNADVGQFGEIIGINVKFEETLLKSSNENWRIIKRAALLYEDILKSAEENKIINLLNLLDLDESAFFRCVTLAESCYYNNSQKEKLVFEKNDFAQFSYEYDKEDLGEEAGHNFYFLFAKGGENNAYKEIVRAILKSLVYSDSYSAIFDMVRPKASNSILEKYPFNKELFYLDDEGHKAYKKAFFESIELFDFSDKQQQQVLISVLSNCIDELNKNNTKLIIDRIINTIPVADMNRFVDTLLLSINSKNEKLNAFIDELRTLFTSKSNKEEQTKLNSLFTNHNYKELTNFLYENKYVVSNKKENILSFLSRNDFFLPVLSKEVDYSSWGYCHEVARFVAGTEYEKMFINVLGKQCKKSKSKELRKKCNALVQYNFGIEMDFFESYPIKK